MVVKKFFGATTRDALKQVRNELGEDALILSNRPVGGGVEIMAVADADVSALASSMKPGAAAAVAPPAWHRYAPLRWTSTKRVCCLPLPEPHPPGPCQA